MIKSQLFKLAIVIAFGIAVIIFLKFINKFLLLTPIDGYEISILACIVFYVFVSVIDRILFTNKQPEPTNIELLIKYNSRALANQIRSLKSEIDDLKCDIEKHRNARNNDNNILSTTCDHLYKVNEKNLLIIKDLKETIAKLKEGQTE